MSEKRIAVVGSGISGLAASWILHKNGLKVTLFEREVSAGGHTLTDHSGPVPIDLGFQVYNLTTYPHLVGFLDSLGVETESSDMSFALSMDGGELEWGSQSFKTLFSQKRNLFDLGFWRMIFDVLHFNKNAPKVLDPTQKTRFAETTLGQYLAERNYGDYFVKYYLLPMCAAIWSVPFSTVMEFPIQVLVQFWRNHHLLEVFQRPVWRVVKDRSIQYVNQVLSELPDTRLNTEVLSLTHSEDNQVLVETPQGVESFDCVILATHADTSLSLMKQWLDPEESEILEAIPYQENEVYLHTDRALMPKERSVWASWNVLGTKDDESSAICVSYWLNHLQNLDETVPDLFVTLNPPFAPQPNTLIRRLKLAHPIFNFSGVQAQERLVEIQGKKNVYYCGAWCRYGFHEDGILSAVKVIEMLNCKVPWIPRSVHPKWSLLESFWMKLFTSFAKRGIKRGSLKFILPNGSEMEFGNQDSTSINSEEWRQGPDLKATVRILDMKFFKKVVFRSDTGLGEAYMDEEFVVDDLGAFMAILVINAKHLSESQNSLGIWNYLGEWILAQANKARPNTISGSKENIKRHYDLGNEIYELFLDPSMTYSCGIHSPERSLLDAQLAKLDSVIEGLGIRKEDHVLEIGCGWGSFSIRVAQLTGCRVTGLTLSHEQLKEGRERIRSAGLESLVNLEYCDYRQWKADHLYDKIVSIEMIEGVGHEHLDDYFDVISTQLKPNGKVFLQAITIPNQRYSTYCNSSDFIREYIFLGGHLPSLEVIQSYTAQHGLVMEKIEDIGLHYAITLREWRLRWNEKKGELESVGCDGRLHRMFEMYFAYCEAAFEARYIHTMQMIFTKTSSERSNLTNPSLGRSLRTQILMMVYFTLARILVFRRPYMWLMPISSMVFVFLFCICSKFAPNCFSVSKGNVKEKAIWTTYCIQCIYSLLIGILSALHCLKYRFSPMDVNCESKDLLFYCAPLCATLGFYGFQVWNVVYHRLYDTNRWILGFYTLMLILLGYLAYKVEQVGWVTLMLTSHLDDFLDLVSELGQHVHLPYKATLLMVLNKVQKLVFVAVKLVVPVYVVLEFFRNEAYLTWTSSYYVFVFFAWVWIVVNCASRVLHNSFSLKFVPSLKQD